jgi:serine/threonine-protein kinase
LNTGDLIQSRYRLLRELGSGASGSVWAARNELIERDVALKIMRPEVAQDAVALQRFFNEAKASGRVRSPAIVEILDLGQAEDGSPFLVFELLEGEGLDACLRREGVLDPERAMELFSGVARALALAHAQSIIHRDLKPANIFLHRAQTGEIIAKILDFGISKVFGGGNNFSLTRTGTVVGSPAYMSPEQAAGREDLDGRADVWSLGVLMYEALTGTLPFDAANYNALMVRILTQDADPVMTRRVSLPPSVCAIVDGCLRREPSQRTPSAEVAAQQMDAALHELRAMRFQQGPHASMHPGDFHTASFGPRPTDYYARGAPPGAMTQTTPDSPRRLVLFLAAAIGIGVGLIAVAVGLFVLR